MDFRSYVRARLPALEVDREDDIVEELAEHLDDVYREGLARDLGHDEAWAQAVAVLPAAADELATALRTASRTPIVRSAESCRARLDEQSPASGGIMLARLQRDFRYALRTLVREPGFAAVVVITLALGIGGTAATFSAIDAILLQQAPVAEPDRVVSVYTLHAARATANPAAGDQVDAASYPDYADLRDSQVLNGLAAFADVFLSLDTNGIAERIEGQVVTGNFFDVLGVHPAIGRTFTADEDRVGSPVRVAVLSHRIWQQHFGADPGIVGRTVSVNGSAYTVIGVAPRGFGGPQLGDTPSLWVPMAMQEEVRPPSAALRQRLGSPRLLGARDVRWLSMVGRLRDGVSLIDAATGVDSVGRRLQTAYPESNRDLSATAMPLGEGPGVRRETRPLLRLLGAAVGLVLLIACANVASLLLARAVMRRREVAVRLAIGASRSQLAHQWLIESVFLGVLGAAAALVVAYWGTPILYGFGIPEGVDLGLSPRVLAFTFAVGVASGVLFGLAPVLQLLRTSTVAALRDEGGSVATGAQATRARGAFVVVQVALSLVLLVGAGLFLRTLLRAYAVDLGYRVDRMLIANIELGDRHTPVTGQAFYADVLSRLNALPGVTAAGAARVTVLSGNARTLPVSVDGRPFQADRSNVIPIRANVVSDRYLDAMGIPILRGRGFQATDVPASPRVAIVSRSLADRLWSNADPIGQTLVSMSPLTVVGVVPDTVYRSTTEREPRPIYYLPLSQNYEAAVSLHVHTEREPMALLPAVRRIVKDVDSRVIVAAPRRLEDELSRSLIEERTMVKFVGSLSVVALLLAAVGLYGVMAYATRQRTTEIGLRLALGATPASILHMIVLRGVRLVAIGGAFGLAGASVAVRFVRGRLFGVEPTDLVTWIAVSAVLVLVSVVACIIPARRAMRIDPAAALRSR